MAAPEAQLKDSAVRIKLRDARTSGLLDLVTLGVYGMYWYWAINRDLALLGRARREPALGEDPLRSFLALVPGYLLIVPAAVSTLRTGRRIELAQRMAGVVAEARIKPVAAMLLLLLLPPLGIWYAQRHLSSAWAGLTQAP